MSWPAVKTGDGMSKLQGWAIGAFLGAVAIAAVTHVVQVDPALRLASVVVVFAVSFLGSLVFFAHAFSRNRG